MRAKFGVLEHTQGLHLQGKFHLNVFAVSASGGQKPPFLVNFDSFGGSCADLLLPIMAKFGVLEQTQGQIPSESVHCVSFRWPKTTILGKF